MQLWRGVVLSINQDEERHTGDVLRNAVPDPSTSASGDKERRPGSTPISSPHRLFEGLKGKSKRKKRSPAEEGGSGSKAKRKRGTCLLVAVYM